MKQLLYGKGKPMSDIEEELDRLYNDTALAEPEVLDVDVYREETETNQDKLTLTDILKMNGLLGENGDCSYDTPETLREVEIKELANHSFIPMALSAVSKNLKYFSFKEYHDSDEGDFYNLLKTNSFLANNPDTITEGLSFIDTTVDIAIVCMYTEDKNSVGVSSSIFEAFEIYQMLKINHLPNDLGGPKIRLIFTDYMVSPETGYSTKTDLGPNKNYGNEILKSIYIKYDGTRALLEEMQRDIIFLNRPKEIIIKKKELPYSDLSYTPSNLVIIDGPTDKNINCLIDIKLVADNLHLPILEQRGFGIELFNSMKDINFFCLYIDDRIKPYIYNIYNDSPRVLIYNDIKRINFWFFRYKDLTAKDPEYNYDRNIIEKFKNGLKHPKGIDFSTKNNNYKRYLLYLTPNSRMIKKDKNNSYSIELLDDIIDSLRITDLNPIAKKIKEDRTQFISILKATTQSSDNKETDTPDTPNTSNTPNTISTLNIDNKELLEAKKLFTDSEYTLEDILNDGISVHFVLVGLDESNSDFEEALLHRAFLRGINATSKVFSFDTLPITNIHSEYDVYIYTPTLKDWDGSPRFIPEAIYYNKKLYFTKLARKDSSKNIALKLRIDDTEKHFGFINEDDMWYFPKMQLTRNLLGYWPK